MRQSALATILNKVGRLTPVGISTTGSPESGWSNAKLITLHYFYQENLLEIEIKSGQRVFIDGDQIEAIMVEK